MQKEINVTVPEEIIMKVDNLNVEINGKSVLKNISFELPENELVSLIGPSDSGKTLLIRTLNRLIDFQDKVKVKGTAFLNDGTDILGKNCDTNKLRRRIGMVFHFPTAFPMSIRENLSLAVSGKTKKVKNPDDKIESALAKIGLWKKYQDNLNLPANRLSLPERQRLCIARALMLEPKILMLDEPTSLLDPIDSQYIEEALLELQNEMSLIVVTHNIQQAARISSSTGFLHKGELIEFGPTNQIFTKPSRELTDNYIKGKLG
ncbi:MAG: ATP-binding cassette domain-containing protein [Leptospiraceae bacterium]|nr:ATP-binding cassette domain-containing protein [Leptospiraceae bacterium]